jgi:hypothetical protein
MQVWTACAVRADRVLRCAKRSVHGETTSVSVSGDSLPPEAPQAPAGPWTMTQGSRTDQRPDLTQCVLSTLGVERAVPLWGKPAAGQASEKTVKNPLVSTLAPCRAPPSGAPGASREVADAALGTADTRAALGAPIRARINRGSP